MVETRHHIRLAQLRRPSASAGALLATRCRIDAFRGDNAASYRSILHDSRPVAHDRIWLSDDLVALSPLKRPNGEPVNLFQAESGPYLSTGGTGRMMSLAHSDEDFPSNCSTEMTSSFTQPSASAMGRISSRTVAKSQMPEGDERNAEITRGMIAL